MYIHDDNTDIITVYIKIRGDIVSFGICVCMAIFISKNCTPRVLKFEVFKYHRAYRYTSRYLRRD